MPNVMQSEDAIAERLRALGQLTIDLLMEHRLQEAVAVMMTRGNMLAGWSPVDTRNIRDGVLEEILDQTHQIFVLATQYHEGISERLLALLDVSPAMKAYAKVQFISTSHSKAQIR
ncbi:hypothetical protein SD51_12295 [Alicyclobacillus tengchongensis]|nr:hypothetical protein SD51_12295 [Alicyclobacillus tengchongensis]